MKIIVMRHTDALSREQAAVPYDADRPLSEIGREHARMVGRFLLSQKLLPAPVLCSPFVRTQECAALVCDGLASGVQPIPVTILAPGSSTNELLKAAQSYADSWNAWLLAVLHEPDVSHILGNLLFNGEDCPLSVKQGDVFVLEVQSGHGHSRGTLVMSYSPARLARVGE